MADAALPLRERNRLDTRRQIADSALTLFAAEGFDAVPVEKICRHARVSRATFFNYFSQKEDVLAEIGRRRLESLRAFVEAQRAWHQPPTVDALVELFADFARQNEEVGRMGRHVIRRALGSPQFAAAMLEMTADLRTRVADYTLRLRKSGRIRAAAQPALVADHFVSVYFWSTLEWSLAPDPPPGQLERTMLARLDALARLLRPPAKRKGTA